MSKIDLTTSKPIPRIDTIPIEPNACYQFDKNYSAVKVACPTNQTCQTWQWSSDKPNWIGTFDNFVAGGAGLTNIDTMHDNGIKTSTIQDAEIRHLQSDLNTSYVALATLLTLLFFVVVLLFHHVEVAAFYKGRLAELDDEWPEPPTNEKSND